MQRFPNVFRRRVRTLGAAFSGLVVVAALGLAGCGSSSSNHTSSKPTQTETSANRSTPAPLANVTNRSDLLTIMQDDGQLAGNPARAVSELAAQGATTIRTIAYWQSFAPDPTSHTEPAGFDANDPAAYAPKVWKVLDGADRAAVANGVTMYVTLDGVAPDWATGPDPQKGVRINAWMPSAAKYAQWVRAMGLRYSGNYTPKGQSSPLPRIRFWSIWNEPNYGVQNAPIASDHGEVATGAAQYRTLLNAGWDALAATGHTTETDTILIGETAPRGVAGPGQPALPAEMMVPLRFIEALYCVDADYKPLRGKAASAIGCPTTAAGTKAFVTKNPALFKATGWADHPYPMDKAPTVNTMTPKYASGYADFANLGGLMNTLDGVTAAYGQHVKLPIYNTEFGYQTGAKSAYPKLTQAQAQVYLNESEYLTWRDPRLRSYDQYLLYDPPESSSTFDSGLYAPSGVAKLTLYSFQMPLWMPKTTASKGTPLEVWGCARQAPLLAKKTHRAQSLQIQLSTDGGTTFKTIKTVVLDPAKGGCYFDTQVKFPASGLVRINWPAGAHYSRFQKIKIS